MTPRRLLLHQKLRLHSWVLFHLGAYKAARVVAETSKNFPQPCVDSGQVMPCVGELLNRCEVMDDAASVQRFEKILLEDSRLDRIHLRRARESSEFEILRPGFVRFSLPYFFDDDLVEDVLQVQFYSQIYSLNFCPLQSVI